MQPKENNINTGLDVKKQESEQVLPEKHLMGAISKWDEIKSNADWTEVWMSLKPETQFGARVETMGCTGFGTSNILEMIWKYQYNKDINISDRALNKMSGTTRNGNSVDAPIDTIRKQGFLLENEWSWDRDTFDWDDYYSAIPANLLAKAKTRLKEWDFEHEYISNYNKDDRIQALKTSPIGGTVPAWYKGSDGLYHDYGYTVNHWSVVIVGYKLNEYWLCADSYPDDFKYNDNPQQPEFLKKLDWNFKFGCLKRYKITAIANTKKKISFIKFMNDYYYYWDKNGHNVFRIGVPAGETKKYRQKMEWSELSKSERHFVLMLRDSMNQSSWAEVSKYPDISTIGKSFV